MSELLLTKENLSEILRISVRQVGRMQVAEQLPAPIYLGRLPRWRGEEIAAWLGAGCPDRQTWEAARKAVTA